MNEIKTYGLFALLVMVVSAVALIVSTYIGSGEYIPWFAATFGFSMVMMVIAVAASGIEEAIHRQTDEILREIRGSDVQQ